MSDKLPVAACDLCLFYFKQNTKEPWSDGQCRKGSAGAYAYGSHVFSFPLTTEGAWCGEFEHKEFGERIGHIDDPYLDLPAYEQKWRFPNER